MEKSLIISGFGGQGVLLIGNLVAQAALNKGLEVAYMPSYGVEMRGGAAMCTVVIADKQVSSPVVGRPDSFIAFTEPALLKFAVRVKEGGLLILNSGMINMGKLNRNDIRVVPVDFRKEAEAIGNPRGMNMIALGVYLALENTVSVEAIEEAFPDVIAEKYHKFIPSNMETIKRGMEIGKEFLGKTL